ncbi:head GIN domain-containing protein [Aequorivita sp. SDUM287046]|uniref:Head GIN domain-containing protein n=1 Tax=Aequorivita aurantiaca TaxID=3053356 RepID=A0ABT8DHB9_9FLAO|nr:head GIN domain-containing protein [Aequorivita aurantiaca]MDN3724363.1 head GIN domain-containing protein [Aequorivita aurantiaca]
MKKLLFIGFLFLLFSCDSENSWDCTQTAGETVSKKFVVSEFSKIRIEDDVTLYLKQGNTQEIILETGKNLLSDVLVIVEENTLVVKDRNACNLVRDYGITKIFVTAPNIVEIRNSSAYDVIGEGILNFPKLTLISNSSTGPENIRKSGDFYLNIVCEEFRVSANGQSVFYISGFTEIANLNFADEMPRFEGENLLIDKLEVFQRSANKMVVNPQQSIVGKIMATGDIVSYSRPAVVEVKEFFTGRLLFKD